METEEKPAKYVMRSDIESTIKHQVPAPFADEPAIDMPGGLVSMTFDVETTSRFKGEGAFAATPFYPENEMLVAGILGSPGWWTLIPKEMPTPDQKNIWEKTIEFLSKGDVRGVRYVLTGHNIGFDLHWMRRECERHGVPFDLKNAFIWDTQVAAYILSGQRMMWASLEDCAKVWLKDQPSITKLQHVSEMVKAGKVEEVPPHQLQEYLLKDLHLTQAVARRQAAHAMITGQFNLILQMSEFLKVVQDIEWNGMHIDLKAFIDDLMASASEQSDLSGALDSAIAELLECPDCHVSVVFTDEVDKHVLMTQEEKHDMAYGVLKDWCFDEETREFTLTSKALNLLLFGERGVAKATTLRKNGFYKSGARVGEQKYRKTPIKITITYDMSSSGGGHVPALLPTWTDSTKIKGRDGYTCDESSVARARTHLKHLGGRPVPLLDKILSLHQQIQSLDKLRHTFIAGVQNALHVHMGSTIIHHSINTTATRTGRTSSSKPNLQNVPMEVADPTSAFAKFPVKKWFNSRFLDGCVVEIDWRQLEIIALAAVSRDPNLCLVLKNGEDIHDRTARRAGFTLPMDEETRRSVKTINFGLIYGGGAPSLAKQAGVPESVARLLINAFYEEFPKTRDIIGLSLTWDGENGDFTLDPGNTSRVYSLTAVPAKAPYGGGPVAGVGGAVLTPAYTQLRNYPVQGLATGDFVPVLATALWHALQAEDWGTTLSLRPCIINMVHDSMVFDVPAECYDQFIRVVNSVLGNAGRIFKDALGCDWFDHLPLKYKISVGPNWGTLTTMKESGII